MKNAEDLLLSLFFFAWKYWSSGVDFDCSKYGLLAGTFHWRRAGAGSVSSYHFAKWIRTNPERKRRILLKLIHWSAMMKDHKRDKLKNIIENLCRNLMTEKVCIRLYSKNFKRFLDCLPVLKSSWSSSLFWNPEWLSPACSKKRGTFLSPLR